MNNIDAAWLNQLSPRERALAAKGILKKEADPEAIGFPAEAPKEEPCPKWKAKDLFGWG